MMVRGREKKAKPVDGLSMDPLLGIVVPLVDAWLIGYFDLGLWNRLDRDDGGEVEREVEDTG